MAAITTRYTQTSAVARGTLSLLPNLLQSTSTDGKVSGYITLVPSTSTPTGTFLATFNTSLSVENYDDAEVTFFVALYGDKPLYGNTGVVWGLDNIGTSAPDGALDAAASSTVAYTQSLSGTVQTVLAATHAKGNYPSVTVINSAGETVSTTVTYTAGNITIESSQSLTNHLVIIRN